jgi:hypothetical protein
MKSHSSLLSGCNLTKPCLSRQVFQGSRRWTGSRDATVPGLKPSRQCSQPGSLNPGAALELEGRVKLIKHSQASLKETSHTRLSKAQAREGQRSGSGRRTWPDANDAPPVYRVDLTPPVRNVEHGKVDDSAWAVAQASLPQGGPGKAAWRGSKKPRPVGSRPDTPTSIWSRRAGKFMEPLNRERQMKIDARRFVRPETVLKEGSQVAINEYCQAGRSSYEASK